MVSARNRCFLYLRYFSSFYAFTVLYIMYTVQSAVSNYAAETNYEFICKSYIQCRLFKTIFIPLILFETYFELHCAKLKFDIGHFYLKTGR